MDMQRFHRRVPLLWPGESPWARGSAPERPEAARQPPWAHSEAGERDGPRPVPGLRSVRAFKPPARPAGIDLFLDSNEGPTGTGVPGLERLDARLVREYPNASGVQRLWASRLGIGAERMLITAGGDEATDRICRAFLCPGREIILPVPTFEMLGHYPRLVGARTVEIAWPPGRPYPIEEVIAAVTERTAVIAVVSPNNPTGTVATARDLMRLARAAPHALLLVDQAYTEFAETDLTPAALEIPSAVVIRTLSKAAGLAGLRIGCAIGAPGLIEVLRAAGGPFTSSGPSLSMAAAAIERGTSRPEYLSQVSHERTALAAALNTMGSPGRRWAESWPSQGNFVMARFADADSVQASLARAGIAVRKLTFPWRAWPLDNCIRITCPGDARAFARLMEALRRAHQESEG